MSLSPTHQIWQVQEPATESGEANEAWGGGPHLQLRLRGLDRLGLGQSQVGWWSSSPKVALIANIWSPFGRKPLTSGPQIIQRRVQLFELFLMCLQSFHDSVSWLFCGLFHPFC